MAKLTMSDYERTKALALGWVPPEELTVCLEQERERWRARYDRDTKILRDQILRLLPDVDPEA